MIGANHVWPKHARSYIRFFGADRGRNPLEHPGSDGQAGHPATALRKTARTDFVGR